MSDKDYAYLSYEMLNAEQRLEMSTQLAEQLADFTPKDVTGFVFIWSTANKKIFGMGGFGKINHNMINAIEEVLEVMKKEIAFESN